ncbi:hypothetical protein MADA3029_420060 [Vibrio nigripulchritudo MADA3029]|uniref:Uncharacterized protein n=1 Tax=Vibrio nigripulchritudo TaxID=28173 RepID=U4KI85_9VIBR|nr:MULTISPECIES: hypothetical protein [Vibrio]KJY73731.1 hypothetical protein TW74_20660 [Vibrio nigripulchritudo]UAB73631.1 hypothetical protein INR79_20980 [Vibrio sp. SCSIO 43132]CCN46595.1 hypothetical protein VIBNIMADA3020_160060 [Vibrio nigripulchritudo MADA3020]CCN54628.1 hypothetical protein VIBNIMADA3021_560117 [Vibrio nigripulchritudo MADA3021]CCN59454.1 hypothetical protein MADA3029_420060 [Vibrio nigripulchritudo MADA3029]
MKKLLLFLSVLLVSNVSFADSYKECVENTSRVYVGDDGILWLSFKDGGSALIKRDDPDFKNILTVVTAAHMANRSIIVRYVDPAATCSGPVRSDVRGVWLN